MVFREDIKMEEFNSFVNNNIGGSFTQNYAWKQFKEAVGGMNCYIVGMEDDNGTLVAAGHFVYAYKRKIKNLYAPSGPILDYSNKKIVKEFFKYLTEFAKKIGADALDIEPNYVIREYNRKFEIEKENDEKIINNLKEVGFNHLGYVGQIAGYQLRFTSIIDLTKPIEEVTSAFAKDKKKLLSRNDKYFQIKIVDANEDDLVYLNKFRTQLSDKKSFKLEGQDYYNEMYRAFKENSDARIIKAVMNFKEIENRVKNELNILEDGLEKSKTKEDTQNIINSLKQKLSEMEEYAKNHDVSNDVIVGIGLIVYIGNRATYIYEHTDKELGNFGVPTIMLNELIKSSKEQGFKEFDMLGLTNPKYKDNKNYYITEFKISFGGNIIEYVGVFVKPIKRLNYFLKSTARDITYRFKGIANERK